MPLMLALIHLCWYSPNKFNGRNLMKKALIITSLILSGILILDSMNFGHAVMMFLLAGQIPGTSIFISAKVMLEMFALASGFVVARVMNRLFTALLTRKPIRTLA